MNYTKIIENSKLIEENDHIIIALSGGPDSIFLFHHLLLMKEKYNLTLHIAHLNHNLRGENSRNDADFIKSLGDKHNIETFIKTKDILDISKKLKISVEECGRIERYKFFENIKAKTKADKVALAHNKEDNIETFIFRLMRGTSLSGLASIPKKRNFYIRPILDISKEKILLYLKKFDIPYKVDKSNYLDEYTRNKIRLNLIPYIEENYNINFKKNIFNIIKDIKEVETYLNSQIKELIKSENISFREIKNFPAYMKKRILAEYLKKNNFDYNRNKLEEIYKILYKNGTKTIYLDDKYMLIKEYDYFYIDKIKKYEIVKNEALTLQIPSVHKYGNYTIITKYATKINNRNNYFYIKSIKGNDLVVRGRKEGDKIHIPGMTKYKKIKKILIDKKIPRFQRDFIPIFQYGDEIIYVFDIAKSVHLESEESGSLIEVHVKEEKSVRKR